MVGCFSGIGGRRARDGAVLLAWKKYANHDEYRAPTLFALTVTIDCFCKISTWLFGK